MKKMLSIILLILTTLIFLGCSKNHNLERSETENKIKPIKTLFEYGNIQSALSQLIIENIYNNEVVSNIIINIDSYPFKANFDLCQKHNSYADNIKDVSHIKPCFSEIVINNLRQSYSMYIKEQRLDFFDKDETVSLYSKITNPHFVLKNNQKIITLEESEKGSYINSFKRKVIFKVLK